MKLTEHLKAIERFVLDHKPPPEIRTHLHVLEEHLEADDSLLDRIAKSDANHAAVVATMSADKAKVDKELLDLKAHEKKAMDDFLTQKAKAAQKSWARGHLKLP